jgi:amino acid transporter
MARLVLATALLGNLTAWNALLLAGSRVLFALGRARLCAGALGEIHPRLRTPWVAIALISATSIVALFLGRGFILPLVNVTSICFGLMYIVTCLTLIRIRGEQGAAPRAYSAPGGRATAAVAAAASLAIVAVAILQPWLADRGRVPSEWLTLAGWMALGGLLWAATGRSRGSVSEARRWDLLRGGLKGETGATL